MPREFIHLPHDVQNGGFNRADGLDHGVWLCDRLGGGDLEKLAQLLDVMEREAAAFVVKQAGHARAGQAQILGQRVVLDALGLYQALETVTHPFL